MRVRASSTATHRNGAITRGRRKSRPRAGQHADEQTKKAVIETEIAAEKKKSEQSLRRTEAAVLAHRVVDPVTRARVPQDSAHVTQKESLPGRGRAQPQRAGNLEFPRRTRTQQGKDQRRQRNPRENINAGQRKDDDLKNSREGHQQPGAGVDLPHGKG